MANKEEKGWFVEAQKWTQQFGKEMCLNLYSMEESPLKMTPFQSLCV
jgi:hypothetical protein